MLCSIIQYKTAMKIMFLQSIQQAIDRIFCKTALWKHKEIHTLWAQQMYILKDQKIYLSNKQILAYCLRQVSLHSSGWSETM